MQDEPAGSLPAAPAPDPKPRLTLTARVGRFYAERPWLGCVGTVASVIGIPLAFYLAPSNTPQLMFKVSQSRSVVVAKSQVGGLRVLHGDQEVHGDVTAVQMLLWNGGRGPARGSEVLEPVRIVTSPPTPILTATVQSVTRPLTELSLDTSALASGIVPVHFKILERGDGARLQLVYAGPPSVQIAAVGVLEGQSAIEAVGVKSKASPVVGIVILALMGIALLTVIVGWFVGTYKKEKGSIHERITRTAKEAALMVAAWVLVGAMVGLVGLLMRLLIRLLGPPAGPFPL